MDSANIKFCLLIPPVAASFNTVLTSPKWPSDRTTAEQ